MTPKSQKVDPQDRPQMRGKLVGSKMVFESQRKTVERKRKTRDRNPVIRTQIGRFTMTPEWLFEEVSEEAVMTYVVIGFYADRETLQCFPSRDLLAKRMGVSVRTVDRRIGELTEAGALVVGTEPVPGRPFLRNVYTLVQVNPKS